MRLGRLHVITDETIQKRYSHLELAALAARGGADVIQYREKRAMDGEICSRLLERIFQAIEPCGAMLVVDDRVHAARAAGVHAVHLGRNDMPVAEARRILGPEGVIGGTANSLQEARAVAGAGVDYLGVGPVFPTASKENPAPALGLDLLRRIVREIDRPVVAIGGIDPGNIVDVFKTGVHGVAVLSAVICQPDPEAAARDLANAIEAVTKENTE